MPFYHRFKTPIPGLYYYKKYGKGTSFFALGFLLGWYAWKLFWFLIVGIISAASFLFRSVANSAEQNISHSGFRGNNHQGSPERTLKALIFGLLGIIVGGFALGIVGGLIGAVLEIVSCQNGVEHQISRPLAVIGAIIGFVMGIRRGLSSNQQDKVEDQPKEDPNTVRTDGKLGGIGAENRKLRNQFLIAYQRIQQKIASLEISSLNSQIQDSIIELSRIKNNVTNGMKVKEHHITFAYNLLRKLGG